MQSRRVVLQASAGALAAVVAAPLSIRAQALAGRRALITTVVFDERIAACRDFADEAARYGADALSMEGDVTELWYDDLRSGLKVSPTIIAGLTQEPAANSLRSLARDVDYYQIYRGDHVLKDRAVHHRVVAPANVKSSAQDLPNEQDNWSTAVAAFMSEIDTGSKLRDRTTIGRHVHTYSDDESRLVSWVLAPIHS